MDVGFAQWIESWMSNVGTKHLRFGMHKNEDVVFVDREFKRGEVVAFDTAAITCAMPDAFTDLFKSYSSLAFANGLPGIFDKRPYRQRANVAPTEDEEKIIRALSEEKTTDDGFVVVKPSVSDSRAQLLDQLRAVYRYATPVPNHDGTVSVASILSFVPVMRKSDAYNVSAIFMNRGAFIVAECNIPANSEICISRSWTGAHLHWVLMDPASRTGDCPVVTTVISETAQTIVSATKRKGKNRAKARAAIAAFGPLLLFSAVVHRNRRVIKSIRSMFNDCREVSDAWRRHVSV